MSDKNLKETLQTVKDLILFDSIWNKRHKLKSAKRLPEKAIKRLEVYRDLVKGSFNELLKKIYPNIYKLTNKEWKSLLSKYIEVFPPASPMLGKVGEKFPVFLSKQKKLLKKYPFIAELALYEWLELEIYEKEDYCNSAKKNLILNPTHKFCEFKYPIPEIVESSLNLKNISMKPTNLLIYRDPNSFKVRFMELSLGTLDYLELVKKNISDKKIIDKLASQYKIDRTKYKYFINELMKLKQTLIEKRILIWA